MAQTAATRYQGEDDKIDYTPNSDVAAGAVVVVGTIPMIAEVAIASGVKGALSCEGVFKVPQKAEVFAAGDAVYWDTTGNPYGGTAGSGAATGTASGASLMGIATAATGATDTYVKVLLTAAKRTTAIAGSVTADDITGSDSTLTVTGLAGNASAGGSVSVVGGAAAAGAYNGGAVGLIGGAGPTAGNAGGAASLISGAGDATNGTAGAVVIDSGAGATKGVITIGTNATDIRFVHQPKMPQATLAANGGNIGTAAALTAGTTVVSGSDNTKGVQLPSCAAGVKCVVVNQNTDKTLKIYPPTGKTIGAVGANNAITLVANGIAVIESYDTNTYYAGIMAGIVS